jgi:hypothetical protein
MHSLDWHPKEAMSFNDVKTVTAFFLGVIAGFALAVFAIGNAGQTSNAQSGIPCPICGGTGRVESVIQLKPPTVNNGVTP